MLDFLNTIIDVMFSNPEGVQMSYVGVAAAASLAAKAGAKAVTKVAVKAGTKAAVKSGTKAAVKSGTKAASKGLQKGASKGLQKAATKGVSKGIGKFGLKGGMKTGGKLGGKTTGKLGSKSGTKLASKAMSMTGGGGGKGKSSGPSSSKSLSAKKKEAKKIGKAKTRGRKDGWLKKTIEKPGKVAGAGLAIATGLGQMIKGKIKKAQADKLRPGYEDPDQRAALEATKQQMRSANSGTDAITAANLRAINQGTTQTQQAISRNTGGNVGGTISGLLQSQRTGATQANQAYAGAAGRSNYFQGLGDMMQSRISQRKLELGMQDYQQKMGEAMQAKKSGFSNIMQGGSALMGQTGNNPDLSAMDYKKTPMSNTATPYIQGGRQPSSIGYPEQFTPMGKAPTQNVPAIGSQGRQPSSISYPQ